MAKPQIQMNIFLEYSFKKPSPSLDFNCSITHGFCFCEENQSMHEFICVGTRVLTRPSPGAHIKDSVRRSQLPGVGVECSWNLDDAPHPQETPRICP